MTYSIDPIPNRHRKKRTHFSGVFIFCIAFLAFVVIGLTVSLSIRACLHHKSYAQEEIQHAEPTTELVDTKYENIHEASLPYEMPDSVVWICMPRPLDGISEQIIRKSSYIVSYNKDTKIPNWVAWHLTAEHTDGPYMRMSNYYEEESVSSPRATIDDYRGSGWSRGHMCPAGDNKWNETAMYESFSLVNVCPQNANLNSGLWNSLESDCRRWARRYGDIYIVCGPVFLNREHETIGVNDVFVPEAFFKVVLCLNGIPKGLGVIVRNTDGNRKRDLYYNSIDQVERITGIDFFPTLPDELKDSIESNVDMNLWN
jgi:endonuclease G